MSEAARPSLRQQQAEEVRAKLRGAFIALVVERGGLGFSLQEVAEAVGVSDPTLYRHYPSREALIEAIATEEAARMEAKRPDRAGDEWIHPETSLIADVFDIRDLSELERVQAGDILVCPTTVAAWSTVFPVISGVVTEHGGLLSHPAILAREFGLPAVLGVPGATDRLVDGTEVEIDGGAGTVTLA
jgi:AcrR family transcriptional regulator